MGLKHSGKKATDHLKLWVSNHLRDWPRLILPLVGRVTAPPGDRPASPIRRVPVDGTRRVRGGLLLPVVSLVGGAGSFGPSKARGILPMGSTLPAAEKKRAKTSVSKRPIRDALLKPKTWKSALAILRTILKIVHVVAKFGELFE